MVIHNLRDGGADQNRTWHSRGMSDEWLLSITDVAEALGCGRTTVLELIERGELDVVPGRRLRVAHSALRAFVEHMQNGALSLGVEPIGVPGLLASQPTGLLNDHPTD